MPEIPEWFQNLIAWGGGLATISGGCVAINHWILKPLRDFLNQQKDEIARLEIMEKEINDLKEKNKRLEADAELNKRAQLALLHDRIYQMCTFLLHRGYTTIEDLENLKYLFDPYKEQGGNGTASTLVLKVKELPVRKTDEIQ